MSGIYANVYACRRFLNELNVMCDKTEASVNIMKDKLSFNSTYVINEHEVTCTNSTKYMELKSASWYNHTLKSTTHNGTQWIFNFEPIEEQEEQENYKPVIVFNIFDKDISSTESE